MTFLIAEVGINANGSVDLARKIMDSAKWAGADACKFQKRTVATVYAGELDKPRESPWGKTLGQQKYGLEFDRHQWDQIVSHAEGIDIPLFASAWDLESLDFLRSYDFQWNKIASAMVTNLDLVHAVSDEGKPVFMSTAMCDAQDIEHARAIIERQQCDLTLMHCVGVYPCPENQLNLRCITTLQETFGLPVGYSGHESSVSPSVVAVVLGAVAVERHITLDRTMYGSDQAASLEPHGFKQLVDTIRKIPTVMGDGVKRMTEPEREVARKLRWFEKEKTP